MQVALPEPLLGYSLYQISQLFGTPNSISETKSWRVFSSSSMAQIVLSASLPAILPRNHRTLSLFSSVELQRWFSNVWFIWLLVSGGENKFELGKSVLSCYSGKSNLRILTGFQSSRRFGIVVVSGLEGKNSGHNSDRQLPSEGEEAQPQAQSDLQSFTWTNNEVGLLINSL